MTHTTRNFLLNIFFILIFSMISYGFTCGDTDGGINRLITGRVDWDVGELLQYWDCCIDGTNLNEYYCSGGIAYSTSADCVSYYGSGSYCDGTGESGSGCGGSLSTGKCVIGCTDNDGLNYVLKSNVSYNSNYYYDSCQDKTRLNEYICSGSPESPHIEQINCSTTYGGWWWNCSNGICNEGLSCSDSDYGKDYFNKGNVNDMNYTYTDYCLYPYINGSDDLVEYFCNSTTGSAGMALKDCSLYGEGWSCFNGVCNIQSCLDVDGENYFSEGYVMYGAGNNTEIYTDYCEKDIDEENPTSPILWEYLCNDEQQLDVIEKDCSVYGDNYECQSGRCIETSAPDEDCPYPILFCDKFNYMSDISINGWRVYNFANNLNQLSPINDRLEFYDFDFTGISYSLNPFNLQFFKNGYWYYILETPYSPVMTVQFDVFLNYTNYTFNYDDYLSNPCLSLKAKTVNNYYLYWFLLCDPQPSLNGTFRIVNGTLLNTVTSYTNHDGSDLKYYFGRFKLPPNEKFNFKISHYFKNRDVYDEFDSNIPFDYYRIWIDEKPFYVNYYTSEGNITSDIILYALDDFSNSDKDSIKTISVESSNTFIGYIDNFYIITGDDKYYDTTMDYFGNVSMEFYEEGVNATGTAYTQPKDFAKEIDKIWSTFGLRSTASKTLFGLLLLCMIGIALIAMFISTHNPVNFPAIAFILIIFMVLFVYLKLLPMWIPIILGIIAVGIIVWLVKTHFTSGGS